MNSGNEEIWLTDINIHRWDMSHKRLIGGEVIRGSEDLEEQKGIWIACHSVQVKISIWGGNKLT